MKFRLPLSSKLLILVATPVLLNLGLLGTLSYLQDEAEREAQQAEHSRMVHESINQLTKDFWSLVSNTPDDHSKDVAYVVSCRPTIQSINDGYNRLLKLYADSPEKKEVITRSKSAWKNALKLVFRLQEDLPPDVEDLKEQRKETLRQSRKLLDQLISQELLDLSRREKSNAEASPERQAQYRQRVRILLFLVGLITLLFSSALAAFLARSISSRLQTMYDNTIRLANDKSLKPVCQGDDEIARLDQVFHEMADDLREAARKERAIVEDARDMICSFDSEGNFVKVNPACLELLGFSRDEMLAMHFVDLVQSDQAGRALESFSQIEETGKSESIELQLKRKDGTIIEAIWSARWSEAEKSMFCVVHDITERRMAERIKQEVMNMITHDLRSPLTSIKVSLDMIGSGKVNQQQGDYLINVAARNCERMMNLMNDLLDLEKFKAGMMILESTRFPLAHAFQETVQLITPWARELDVQLLAKPTTAVVSGDEDKINRVLTNLISNALKFSPKGGQIEVSARPSGTFVEVSVRDQGPGIPADMLELVFSSFQQVNSAANKSKGGTGLGLAICKAIVELHGGEIWVESEHGKGSNFKFTLPSS